MRGRKRAWIYAGLGVPEGRALVRPVAPHAYDPARVLLAGTDEGRGLVAPLSRLAAENHTALKVDCRIGATSGDWAVNDWLDQHLAVFRPTTVLFVGDRRFAGAITEKVNAGEGDARLLWLAPSGSRAVERVEVAVVVARSGTASGYAAWAGQAWAAMVQ